ncbi:MAG TPA: aminoacetone oxidase family FAD-binding enzyme, partial [Fimbriimonadaceae bacterium]|nr:aminoacetone oxidase family FAD-binding enzyme [Fimbriimonadaceae bacterium]
MSRHIIIVGAGAAGIIASWRAAHLGARVTVLEKNDRIGIKILISGGGKCNITHAGEVEELLRAFRPNEARFLRPSMYRFRSEDILDILRSEALRVYTRPDGRVFPVEGTAKDVVGILRRKLLDAGVDIRLKAAANGLIARDGRVVGVKVGDEALEADAVIVCVGGSSYPASGTTGDGWTLARELGHSIVPIHAALAPIDTDPPPEGLAGVALRDVVLKARQSGKEIARWTGDLVFTHRGISGPCALGVSRVVAEKMKDGPVTMEVDLLPDSSFEDL